LGAMLTSATAKSDPALVVKPAAPWRIAKVDALPAHRLRVTFLDGLSGEVELGRWLFSASVTGTIFESLRDEAIFQQVFLDMGAVTWPNGADLAPDAMHEEIRQNGRWVLE
jgi:hypothetical protein